MIENQFAFGLVVGLIAGFLFAAAWFMEDK